MAEYEIGANRRHLVEPGFPELPLYIVLFSKAKPAVHLQAGIGGLPTRFRGQQLRHVCLRATRLPGVKKCDCFGNHLGGRLQLNMGARNGELNPLVLPNWSAKDRAFAGIFCCSVYEKAPIANAFAGN